MKNQIGIAIVVLLLASQSMAGFTISKKIHRMNQFDEAKAEASSDGKPITFIYTDTSSSCGLCASASLNAIDRLKSKTVVVYINSGNEWNLLPSVVQDALRKPEAGKYIPKTVIVNPEIEKVIAIVPYVRSTKEQNKLLKQARKEIVKAMPKTTQSRKPLSSLRRPSVSIIQPDDSREMRTWKAKSGSEIQASLVEEKGIYLVLRTEDGNKVQISLSRLSAGDRQYVSKLKKEFQESVNKTGGH